MAEGGYQLGHLNNTDHTVDNKFQADLPTSSLASLHLRGEDVVITESTSHMGNNPESQSVCPVMMSSQCNQSQRQTDISTYTRPEPSPAVKGKPM